jgi:hypothetical protein
VLASRAVDSGLESRCRCWNFLSHLTSPRLFGDYYLLARQIQVLAPARRKLLSSLWQIQWDFSGSILIFVVPVSNDIFLFVLFGKDRQKWQFITSFVSFWLHQIQGKRVVQDFLNVILRFFLHFFVWLQLFRGPSGSICYLLTLKLDWV